jgi:hypothetical protein
MFSSQYSGEPHPHREEVVAEVEEVEDLLAVQTQPSNQWHQPLMSAPWERNPKTSTETERKLMTSLRK